ncbi:MAG: TIGR04211 family SH3 domain-containing protein [Methylococcales bacterium]|nr:TIGR04211 family SH3 domain-containing protein [Methylococcales bacterium]
MTGWVHAKTLYVTDNVKINLRAGDSNKSKIIATLPSGTALTYISKQPGSNFAKVRMPNGRYAFVLNSQTTTEPTNKLALVTITTERDKLSQENDELEAELLMLRGDSTAAETSKNSLTVEREKLTRELEDLKYTSSHAIKIKTQRDSLQEQVVQTQKELEEFKLENQTLKANIKLEWFLWGGCAIFFSILLGAILPKLGWRKRSHNWD